MSDIWISYGGGADLDVITAGAADVRKGKVIVDKEGEPLVGTMATMAGGTYIPTTAGTVIACSGKAMTSNITIPAFSLPSSNIIRTGQSVTIYGQTVWGSFEGYNDTWYNIFNDGNTTGINYNGIYTNWLNVGTTVNFLTNSDQTARKGVWFNSPISFSGYSKLYVRYACNSVALSVGVVNAGADYGSWEVSSATRYSVGGGVYEVALDIHTIARQPTVFIGTSGYSPSWEAGIYRIVLGRPL